jgi:hypothetical protein
MRVGIRASPAVRGGWSYLGRYLVRAGACGSSRHPTSASSSRRSRLLLVIGLRSDERSRASMAMVGVHRRRALASSNSPRAESASSRSRAVLLGLFFITVA